MPASEPHAEATRWLVTCEHGGAEVPERYRSLFSDAGEDLRSHRAYDLGALELFRALADSVTDGSQVSTVTRLLVDLNRSVRHPHLFSRYTRQLSREEKEQILRDHYWPYRQRLERRVARWIESGHGVVHLTVHSFTPVLDGNVRKADIGLLYDPRRKQEAKLCRLWKQIIGDQDPSLGVRLNYPYRGIADGLTTGLRKRFTERYWGLELEVNQRHLTRHPAAITGTIRDSLLELRREWISNS
jgi:predicted N-formylglutamate amidohydrolase